jgi:metal-responsive CopG/Arc/MetJ family transcriptional regulator
MAKKRKGAGRPIGPDGPTMLVAVTVPKSLMKDLDRLSKAEGWKRSQAVTEAIRGLLKRKAGD